MAKKQVIQKRFVFSAQSQHFVAKKPATMKTVEQETSPAVCKHQPQCVGCEQALGVPFQHWELKTGETQCLCPQQPPPLHVCPLPALPEAAWCTWMKAAAWRSPGMSISPPSWRTRCQGLPEAAGITGCPGRGRRAAACSSALGVFGPCLLSCCSRQAKKWLGFQETPTA